MLATDQSCEKFHFYNNSLFNDFFCKYYVIISRACLKKDFQNFFLNYLSITIGYVVYAYFLQ